MSAAETYVKPESDRVRAAQSIEEMWQSECGTLAGLAVFGGGEAHLALTAVPAGSVQALAVFTQVHVVRTLIHVCNRAAECRVSACERHL